MSSKSVKKPLTLLDRYNRLVPKFLRLDPTFPFFTPDYIVIDLSKIRPQGNYLIYVNYIYSLLLTNHIYRFFKWRWIVITRVPKRIQ